CDPAGRNDRPQHDRSPCGRRRRTRSAYCLETVYEEQFADQHDRSSAAYREGPDRREHIRVLTARHPHFREQKGRKPESHPLAALLNKIQWIIEDIRYCLVTRVVL